MHSAIDKHANELPVSYIVCNFTQPLKNQPSLIDFDEVQTLFHEMGHALHQLLTDINHYTIAGTNGVEWDAVELPSQFMEYFVWNYELLTSITKHSQTGLALPYDLFQKMLAARYFQSGIAMLRQLEFALFDIELHCYASNNTVTKSFLNYHKLLDKIRCDTALIATPKFNRFANSFSHIFAGGYAAGYYSYKWAEVLAADIFSQFEILGPKNYGQLGKKFYTSILKQGGLRPMLTNFEEFMNRKPQIDALLHYSGIMP